MTRGASSPRIFQIGFNRCGTTTLIRFFQANNLKCLHWGRGSIAAGIEAARLEGKPLLSYVDGYFAYGDMEFVEVESESKKLLKKKPFRRLYKNLPKDNLTPIYAFENFRELDKQYPGSKFILNTRNVEDWINSRIRFLERGYFYCKHGDRFHSSQEALNQCWREHWDEHTSNVREYFSNRPEDLLEFDLDKDGPEKIADFFCDLNLDISKWGHHNKSLF
ncbi:MAG: sulfotransferase [Candidatus Thalassarchaeaceae archaeon]